MSFALLDDSGAFVASNTETKKNQYRSHPSDWFEDVELGSAWNFFGAVLVAVFVMTLIGLGAFGVTKVIANSYLLIVAGLVLGIVMMIGLSALRRRVRASSGASE